MRFLKAVTAVAAVAIINGSSIGMAQTPANDPSARLKQVLPADVATRVPSRSRQARARELPAEALENRALKFAAKGVHPDSIEKSVVEHEARMENANEILQKARGRKPAGEEVEAGAEVMRKGVDGAKVSELAKSAPSGRSLAVPLYVLGSLVDRGLASDAALKRVEERLKARATDRDLEALPGDVSPRDVAASKGNRPAQTGRELAETKRPGSAAGAGNSGSAGGPPAGVPANGGAKAKPTTPPGQANKPVTPPGKKPE
jgi:hypothetical protein